jgi:hypothetical protein
MQVYSVSVLSFIQNYGNAELALLMVFKLTLYKMYNTLFRLFSGF